MDSLNNILSNINAGEPPQVSSLKKYVKDNYNSVISVRITTKYYLINVADAGIASKLRVETSQIIEACNLDKRLVIHIGN